MKSYLFVNDNQSMCNFTLNGGDSVYFLKLLTESLIKDDGTGTVFKDSKPWLKSVKKNGKIKLTLLG